MNTTPTTPTATPAAAGAAAAPRSLSAPVSPATAPRSRPSSTKARFSPRTRKAVLLLHILSSLTWLGLDVGLLALSLTGYTSDDPATVRAVYLAMNVLGNTVLVPAALLALVTGVVLGLGTKWGLVRHRWVLVKLVITLITATLTIFLLRAGLQQAAAEVRTVPGLPGEAGGGLLFAPIVSLTCYVFMTVISIFKPWGRTRRAPERTA
jgi:uncharacterized membrane protein